ncbi:RNA pseudouridine synthase [Anaerosporomusa subterranea]|uniref:Pseudouridine synthase n=1 Tax=Anaerosporomusa subterranea TaxID=1794912 RepID=A0A154BT88_ANASB|nr:RluA family pseudouridine synthase [Anaerosporomusa subterranea]KYZ77223.1 RNA pseudouridine synthase [Anaerosporomusa subterranea]
MNEQNYTFSVEPCVENQRLDLFVTGQINELSRSHVQKLIIDGQVTVNGRPEKSNYRVRQGDNVLIEIPASRPLAAEPENIKLDIVYEDRDVIVVNKPRNMVVHPAVGNEAGTLVNALLGRCTDLSGINGVTRPGIVHRLDKDTSGVMVVAKNDKAHISLAEQIQTRVASRKYLAIVHGNVKENQGIINAPIGRHAIDRKKMAVTFTNSKKAITRFTVLERFNEYTFLECKLETGRTHQIRVHMAYIGHPVVGDPKYGPKQPHFHIQGQALHSTELAFFHPSTGERLTFTADMPQDMKVIISALRGRKGR